MRRYLRRVCDEGWVIDLTPEGMQPDVATRVFPGVQQTLAIGIFLRRATDSPRDPARIRYRAVRGRRTDKFAALAALELDDDGWSEVRQSPVTAPFTPAHAVGWDDYPALNDLFPATSPGVKANRSWVFAPRAETLRRRWRDLITEDDLSIRAAKLKITRDRTLTTNPQPLDDGTDDRKPLETETGDCPPPTLIGYRSFDRQYVIPDNRVIDFPRPPLWKAANYPEQMFVVEMHSSPIRSGPGVTFTALIPDMHAFKGSEGGRALPVFHPDGRPTATTAMRAAIADKVGADDRGPVAGEDLAAYVAAVVAHPAFTARFAEQLETPGIRVPVTADPDLWRGAVEIGRTILWLHTYGERCVDAASRPRGAVEAVGQARVRNLDGIPATEDGMPAAITHSSDSQSRRTDEDGDDTLYVGDARFRPVSEAVWHYSVGGKSVVKSWFDYRRRNPSGRRSSPLDDINAATWARSDTEEMIRLLGVLHRLTELEGQQADLLDRVCAGDLLSVQALTAAAALPLRTADRRLADTGSREPAPGDD